jgi:hypothetical protein
MLITGLRGSFSRGCHRRPRLWRLRAMMPWKKEKLVLKILLAKMRKNKESHRKG